MTSTRNTPPRHIWDALRRLRACNRQELAAALGITPRTLREWERMTERGESAGANAAMRASDLLIATLRAADGADVYALPVNWPGIRTIGGRR